MRIETDNFGRTKNDISDKVFLVSLARYLGGGGGIDAGAE